MIPVRPDLTGADDAASLLERWCRDHLGADVATVRWARASMGLAIGVDLIDGRHLVVKVRPAADAGHLVATRDLQAALAAAGLPVPAPVGDLHPFGVGVAGADVRVDDVTPIARTEVETVASLFQELTTAATGMAPVEMELTEPWGLALPADQLWPDPPHDPRFDLTVTGVEADRIDAVGRRARAVLADLTPGLDRVVAHADWRAEHVLVDATGVVRAVVDWDALVRAPEAVVVGQAAAGCTIVWGRPEPQPTPDEVAGFVAAYEDARGAPFTGREHEVRQAATVYAVAYGARCELSDQLTGRGDPSAFGWRRLLGALEPSS